MLTDLITQREFLKRWRQGDKTNFYLPHELGFFEQRFHWMVEKQAGHGHHLGEAMDQSAETYHDNAPASAILDDQEVIVNEVRRMRANLNNAIFVDYPHAGFSRITLGSACLLNIAEGGPELCYIVGEPNGYQEVEFDFAITPISLRSPLGSSVIGAQAGSVRKPEINGRPLSINVLGVEQQVWPLEPMHLLDSVQQV